MNEFDGFYNKACSESDVTEIISANTSATYEFSSSIFDFNFLLDSAEVDLSFPFNNSGFCPSTGSTGGVFHHDQGSIQGAILQLPCELQPQWSHMVCQYSVPMQQHKLDHPCLQAVPILPLLMCLIKFPNLRRSRTI